MFYTLFNHYRLGDIITNEQGIIVYPRQYFGKPFPEWEYDDEYDEYFEIPTTFIDCAASLKRLKKEYDRTRYGFLGKKWTDYGRLQRDRRKGRSLRMESAITALRKRREKITRCSVYEEMKRQDAERPRRRRGGTGS